MSPRLSSLLFASLVSLPSFGGGASKAAAQLADDNLWQHDNLVAWCVAPWDSRKRGPDERARMLQKLGFKHYSYISFEDSEGAYDAEIEALKNHGIELTGWYFPLDADDPKAKQILDVFKRHNVHPQLWVALPPKGGLAWPTNQEEWVKLFPEGSPLIRDWNDVTKLSEDQRNQLDEAILVRLRQQDIPQRVSDQEQRVAQETSRIYALVNLARTYNVQVELYNHNGWFGMVDNQLAIIESLKKRGVTSVGIVYNFSHARDELHDDTLNFPSIWKRIQPYVVAVNITGLRWERHYVFPSQGDSELSMMRAIQDSGWRGRVGLIGEKGGDAETTLANYIRGVDWLAAELHQAGSGGPQPFSLP